MSDYKGSNIFEKLGALIPGYKGYSEREGRRDTDKILRDFIAQSLNQKTGVLNRIAKELLKKGNLQEIPRFDEIKRKIGFIADQIKFAKYGESGFFDIVQVDETTLDRLYRFDLEVKLQADGIIQLLDQSSRGENLNATLTAIEAELLRCQETINLRDNLIMEVQ